MKMRRPQTITNHFTGLTTPLLFLVSPNLLPPASPFYGAECPGGFRVSKVFHTGLYWQLRTVQFNDKFYIAPFVINTGGGKSCEPIVSTPLLRKIGAHSGDARVKVPSPLGELTTFSDWDYDEPEQSKQIDERYNVIGYDWATFTRDVELMARSGPFSETAVDTLIDQSPEDIACHVKNPRNRSLVERELRAVMEAVKDERDIDELAKSWAGY